MAAAWLMAPFVMYVHRRCPVAGAYAYKPPLALPNTTAMPADTAGEDQAPAPGPVATHTAAPVCPWRQCTTPSAPPRYTFPDRGSTAGVDVTAIPVDAAHTDAPVVADRAYTSPLPQPKYTMSLAGDSAAAEEEVKVGKIHRMVPMGFTEIMASPALPTYTLPPGSMVGDPYMEPLVGMAQGTPPDPDTPHR